MSSIDQVIPFISKKLNKRLANDEIEIVRDALITYKPTNIQQLDVVAKLIMHRIIHKDELYPMLHNKTLTTTVDTTRRETLTTTIDTARREVLTTAVSTNEVSGYAAAPIGGSHTKYETFDMHEYVKENIGTTEEDGQLNEQYNKRLSYYNEEHDAKLSLNVSAFLFMNSSSLYALSKKLNPSSKEVYNYLYLDSDNLQSANADSRSVFSWVLNYNTMPILAKGFINLSSPISNILRIRLARTVFAYTSEANYDKLIINYPVFNIAEFDSQAMLDPNGIKFHFQQKVENLDGNTITTSGFLLNRGWYRFFEPFVHIDTITLRIFDLFDMSAIGVETAPFSIQAEQYVRVPVVINLPYAGLTYTSPLVIANYKYLSLVLNFLTDYYAETRYTYTISGFTTDTPIVDAAQIELYNQNRLLYQLDGTYFKRPGNVDTNSLGFLNGQTSVPVLLTWNFPARITTILEIISSIEEGTTTSK